MDARATGLKVALELRATGADLVGPLSASILWTSERSGAATEGFVGVLVAGGTAASLHLNAASATRNRPIRLDLNLRCRRL